MRRNPIDLAIYLPSLSGGGAERAMIDLATHMSRRGHRTLLACNTIGKGYRGLLSDRPIEVEELGVHRTAMALPSLSRLIRRTRPRAVLSTITHANVISALASRTLAPAPRIVLRQANTMVSAASTSLRARLSVLAVPWVYRSASAVVAVSEATARDLEANGVPRAKIEVIENGVDHAFVEAQASQPMNPEPPDLAKGGPIIVSLGRLTHQKAFDVLLRAFAELPDDTNLWILGEGSDRSALEHLSNQLGIAHRVWMPGFVSNPFPFLRAADCFVLCSRWEGMPNALVQALSLGTPSVATDAPGGSAEVLGAGNVGWLVPVDRPSALAAGIRGALDEPQKKRPNEQWRVRFSIETMMDRYERTLFG